MPSNKPTDIGVSDTDKRPMVELIESLIGEATRHCITPGEIHMTQDRFHQLRAECTHGQLEVDGAGTHYYRGVPLVVCRTMKQGVMVSEKRLTPQ